MVVRSKSFLGSNKQKKKRRKGVRNSLDVHVDCIVPVQSSSFVKMKRKATPSKRKRKKKLGKKNLTYWLNIL